MKVLVTGSGRSGSWQIRGEQLGRAIGATVAPQASAEQLAAADLVVLVKRAPPALLAALKASRKPVVWDVVDAWPQAHGAPLDMHAALGWLGGELRRIRPHAVVWPTRCMEADAGWSGPQITLPHHGWPRYQSRETAEHVSVVGYEGSARYLGKWRRILEQECARRGWCFEVNGDLQRADIGIALRDGGGYAEAHWKSNCKLANLQRLGIPALCSPESGYQETAGGGEVWIHEEGDIARALECLASRAERDHRGVAARQAQIRLEAVAADYHGWLATL